MRQVYVSSEGAEELATLRVGPAPAETPDTRAPIELLARVPSEECGCPEELWRVDGLIYLIHMELEAGTGEIFGFWGDEYPEWIVQANSIDELRAEMFEHHAAAVSGAPCAEPPSPPKPAPSVPLVKGEH